MTSIADGSVIIQTSAEPVFSTPSWFGEVVLIVKYLQKHGVLVKISEQVRFARKRLGHYDVIDFVAVVLATWNIRSCKAARRRNKEVDE